MSEPSSPETSQVRPYTVSRGRTRARDHLPVEALVEAAAPAVTGRNREEREILARTAGTFLSVAELSAHLRLPIGVVRVLVGDLVEAGHVRVPGRRPADPPASLAVLESVLNGLSAL